MIWRSICSRKHCFYWRLPTLFSRFRVTTFQLIDNICRSLNRSLYNISTFDTLSSKRTLAISIFCEKVLPYVFVLTTVHSFPFNLWLMNDRNFLLDFSFCFLTRKWHYFWNTRNNRYSSTNRNNIHIIQMKRAPCRIDDSEVRYYWKCLSNVLELLILLLYVETSIFLKQTGLTTQWYQSILQMLDVFV